MALSGSFSTSVTTANGELDANYPRNLVVTWTATQNVANNTSTISWTLKTGSSNSDYYYTTVNRVKLIINGTVVYNDQSTGTYRYANTTLGSGSITVSHNSDGAKSVSVYAEAGFYEWTPNSSYSGTITLDTIPRASTMSFPEFTMGSAGTISISRASSGFTHTITYKFGSKSGTITTKTSSTSISWTPSLSELANQMPSATRGHGTLYIYTYSGSTQIGSRSYTFYCNIPSSVVPSVGTITLDPADINGRNILVKGKNKLTVSVSGCSAGTGSSIKSYTFSGPSISSTTTNTSVSTNTVSSSGTLTYKVTVTDNRGRTASKTNTITCYDYYAPYFKSFNAVRSSDNKSIVCNYSINVASVNSTNSTTVTVYRRVAGGTWSSSTTTSGSTYTINLGNDTTSTYEVYATISDSYGGSTKSSTINVFGELRVINITSDGTGVALGKMAEDTELFDCRWPMRSDNPEQTMRNLTYRGTNAISSNTNDTTSNWGNEGNLATIFYSATNQITNQPSQYGFLLNLTNGPGSPEVHQIWATQSSGSLAHRGGNSNGWNGTWKTIFDSSNYTSYVDKKPKTLYSSSDGTTGTITLSESAANFTYLEIFYTDNNGREVDSVRAYSPNGKYITLSCIEPSTSGSEPRVYIRVSGWTISGTSMTVGRSDLSGTNRGVYGQMYPHANGTNIDVKVTENNYIKIFRILGYA